MKTIVGITGGTGAGKSEISAFLKEYGAYVIDADQISREITAPGMPALKEIEETFPGVVEQGGLNRRRLGDIVFSDTKKLPLLNAITHKYIRAKTKELIEKADGLIVLDAPLLYEAGEEGLCDHVIFVDAPEQMRIERICRRDGLGEEEARRRVRARELTSIRNRADMVIENDGDIKKMRTEIERFLKGLNN